MKYSKLIILLLSTFGSNLFGQDQINEDRYFSKINYFKGVNNDSLLIYSKLLKKSKDSCYKYSGYISEALSYYLKNEYSHSENTAKLIIKSISNSEKLCLKKIKIEALNRLFWIRKNQNRYNDAYNILLEIEKEIQTISSDESYYKTMNFVLKMNLATIKSLLGYYDEAIAILKNIISEYNNDYMSNLEHSYYSRILNQSSAYNLIGQSYLFSSEDKNSKKLDSASYYFNQAFKMAKQFNPPHENSETIYHLKKAEVLMVKEEYEASLDLINKYSKFSEKYNTSQNISSLKAICFYNLDFIDSSLYYSRKYLTNYNKRKNNKKRLIAIYDIMSNLYFKRNNLDSAYKYSELTVSELDTFTKDKTDTNKAYHLYNIKNISKLNKEILKTERKSRQWLILILGLLLIALLYYYLKLRKKSMNIETSKLKEVIIQKKEYNIDEELEHNILDGIKNFEQSRGFLNKDFNINMLAKELNTNTSYLSFIFNKNYNSNFKQYLTKLRIDFLLSQLKSNPKFKNYTIKALAEEIGYTNASAFTRAFKKYKGVTPSEYIKKSTN